MRGFFVFIIVVNSVSLAIYAFIAGREEATTTQVPLPYLLMFALFLVINFASAMALLTSRSSNDDKKNDVTDTEA